MKTNIKKADSPVRASLKPIIWAAFAISAFAIILWTAMTSLGDADGEAKLIPAAPDSLVSAGAPRSQLELKRMFESMSLSYTEGGKEVYEPISKDYSIAVSQRIARGEELALSVEEVLYIISDSVAAYEKYDVIRLRGADGATEKVVTCYEAEENESSPFHRKMRDKLQNVAEIIEYRISALSSPHTMVTAEDGSRVYTPRYATKESGEEKVSFVFGLTSDTEKYEGAVVYVSENGEKVALYPHADEAALCRTKVIIHNDKPMSREESELLKNNGWDITACRNITPLYWYPMTNIRIFAVGGKVILADPDSERVTEPLPEGHKLISLAVRNTDGITEIYFSSAYGEGSSVFVYSMSEGKATVIDSSENGLLAMIENGYDGYDRVAVCSAVRREDGRFVTAVECVGEPLYVYAKR